MLFPFYFVSISIKDDVRLLASIFLLQSNYSGLFSLAASLRPVNDAGASTSGQTGRKEAAGWE